MNINKKAVLNYITEKNIQDILSLKNSINYYIKDVKNTEEPFKRETIEIRLKNIHTRLDNIMSNCGDIRNAFPLYTICCVEHCVLDNCPAKDQHEDCGLFCDKFQELI